MSENLVIVESPAKAKTIEKFLGKDFVVKSSYGHIRDLAKKDFGIDINNDYEPQYIVPDDKKAVVKELKKDAKDAKTVWLASDEDREGEAIAWHLFKVLELDPQKTKRIVFHEITKNAIQNAIKNPRPIDENLVNAQQARRILDRLVGFELSPVLWKKVKPSLSAGRVQSVAVKLLVEREREIMNFKSESYFKVTGIFQTAGEHELKADLNERIKNKKEVLDFLEKSKSATFVVNNVVKKPGKKSPAPPFTTSTLQQEASRKLGFSVAQTMAVAQRLYEAGKITYMRTDSVNLSGMAINSAKKVILDEFGEKYLKTRKYSTKSKGAQEAHEAIRPTFIEKETVSGTEREKRLYELIWKRTIASQMSDALLEKTTITIDISNQDKRKFIANGEVLKFDGFLKVYIESRDDENDEETKGLLPSVTNGEKMDYHSIVAIQRFTHHPPRYTEASLVKKLEELGIGRPSTYAPTISTIQNRGYVVKEDRPGKERSYVAISLRNNTIDEETKKEITGAEKSKLFPNDIGMVVNDFLGNHFDEIMNYNFTASVEEEFDEIAQGNMPWTQMIDKFYRPFHQRVDETLKTSARSVGERILGKDPKTGKQILAKIGPYGPMVQLGDKDDEEKPKFASLQRGQHLESITLQEALDLFKLPREIGTFEGEDVVVSIGRFGPYVRHNSKFYSLKKDDNPYKIELDRAIEIIKEKREKDKAKIINDFPEDKDLQLLNGRWGPYISYKKKNYKIPKGEKAEKLSYEDCMKIIKESKTKDTKKPKGKKTNKTNTKKNTKKKNK
ncbi:MAG TPA: type I DNA topoisomerase [Bacteroidales bacterium]|nr:type I DNA topoisomerase [Bacteroidales bacterium]